MYIETQPTIPFGFIDETGLSYPDSTQPFLGIGLFKIYDTHSITDTLLHEYYQNNAQSKKQKRALLKGTNKNYKNLNIGEVKRMVRESSGFEYKFENISERTLDHYINLIDVLFQFKWSFNCILVDKTDARFDPSIYSNYWNAYLMYTKLLVRNATKRDVGISLIADFLNKPRDIQRSFERELLTVSKVCNAMQADSKSLMHLQIVDLLLGAVSFHSKRHKGVIGNSKRSQFKQRFTEHLLGKFNISVDERNEFPLAYNTRFSSPCQFSVWHMQFA